MDEELEALSAEMATTYPAAEIHGSPEQLAIEITQQIFPGKIAIEDGFDPNEPGHRWRTLIATARGELADIHVRKTLWHRRMLDALGPRDVLGFTICVTPENP